LGRRVVTGAPEEPPPPVVKFLGVLDDGTLVQITSVGEGYRKFTVHYDIELRDAKTGSIIS